ncbi:MAG: hypothetical protein WC785_05895 [Tatlockia sp.]|jgi:hypothetical protein
MNEETLAKPRKFIEVVDKDLRDLIVRLDQKLKGLRAEINAKLELNKERPDDLTEMREENLLLLAKDVEEALSNIHDTVNMEIEAGLSEAKFLKTHHEEIEVLRTLFIEKTAIISQLKEQF